jgi:hypothetical protein
MPSRKASSDIFLNGFFLRPNLFLARSIAWSVNLIIIKLLPGFTPFYVLPGFPVFLAIKMIVRTIIMNAATDSGNF